jgi:hypothetical protein
MDKKKLALLMLAALFGFVLFLVFKGMQKGPEAVNEIAPESPQGEVSAIPVTPPAQGSTSDVNPVTPSAQGTTSGVHSVTPSEAGSSSAAIPAPHTGESAAIPSNPSAENSAASGQSPSLSAPKANPTTKTNAVAIPTHPSMADSANPQLSPAPKTAAPQVFIPTKRASSAKGGGGFIPTKGQMNYPSTGLGSKSGVVKVKAKDELDRAKPKSYSGNPEDLLIEGENKLSKQAE